MRDGISEKVGIGPPRKASAKLIHGVVTRPLLYRKASEIGAKVADGELLAE